jgi:outer membrane protein OmpA-like peptidoglycan-associated protein
LYNGPNTLYDIPGLEQENVTEVNPAVTGFVSFPLSGDQLRARLLAGVLNIGGVRNSLIDLNGGNPFLANEQLLLEGDLVIHLNSPATSTVSPYLFGGLGALIADPFGNDDIADDLDRDRVAYVLPLGVGLDLNLTRNLSLFGEASYRLPLNDVGEGSLVSPFFEGCDGDPDCIAKCEQFPEDPECVLSDSEEEFDTKFGSALFTGGLKFGLGSRRAQAFIPPPPPEREIIVERETVYVEQPRPPAPEAPRVCELVELNPVYFDHGSATLSTRAERLLDENIELLLDDNACCVFIDGYTDTSEFERFGMGLSGRRAQAVYDYYLSQGVGASRIQLRNRAAATPPCDKEDPGIGCSRNRRVESLPMDCERFELMLGTGR